MLIVENKKETIDVDEALAWLENSSGAILGYMVKSDHPYFCGLKQTKPGCYKEFGFLTPVGIKLKFTYIGKDIRTCIKKALEADRQVMVVQKEELNRLLSND